MSVFNILNKYSNFINDVETNFLRKKVKMTDKIDFNNDIDDYLTDYYYNINNMILSYIPELLPKIFDKVYEYEKKSKTKK